MKENKSKKPTPVQISYAKFLSRKLNIPLPEKLTYNAYYEFIMNNKI